MNFYRFPILLRIVYKPFQVVSPAQMVFSKPGQAYLFAILLDKNSLSNNDKNQFKKGVADYYVQEAGGARPVVEVRYHLMSLFYANFETDLFVYNPPGNESLKDLKSIPYNFVITLKPVCLFMTLFAYTAKTIPSSIKKCRRFILRRFYFYFIQNIANFRVVKILFQKARILISNRTT